MAFRRAASTSRTSFAKSAYFSAASPLCRVPSNSPAPRSFKSASAITKPSFVSVMVLMRSLATFDFALFSKMQ